MRFTFKYKFILSFVIIELFFISLIVFFNFSSLNTLSKSLIDEKIQVTSKLFTELIKTPLITKDLKTIDSAVEALIKLKNIAGVKIIGKNDNIISHHHNKNSDYQIIFSNYFNEIKIDGRTFKKLITPIIVDGEILGTTKIVFNITDSLRIIQNDKKITYIFVLLEIILSFILVYFIGHKLTKSLNILTSAAEQIAQNDQIIIPEVGESISEIFILSNALRIMQERITQRNNNLVTERNFYTEILNQANSVILVMNTIGKIVLSNKIVEKSTGYTQNEIQGKVQWEVFMPKNIRAKAKARFLNMGVDDFPTLDESIWNTKDGSSLFFACRSSCIINENRDIEYIIIVAADITAKKKAGKELQKYIELVDENVMITQTDLQGITINVSQSFCKFTGYSREELIGQKNNIFKDAKTPNSVYEDLWMTIQSGHAWHGEIRNIAKDGHFYWVDVSIYPDYNDDGEIIGYDAIRLDITNRKLLEELSITDSLTKLYNRRHFDNVFQREINKAKRDKKIFCLLSLDVDNFKLYNDTYGHYMGDVVLFNIANVLKQNMKRSS
ncbi:MAG: PAS domain S-box-containing protein, partial [Sulfurimonas sp.]